MVYCIGCCGWVVYSMLSCSCNLIIQDRPDKNNNQLVELLVEVFNPRQNAFLHPISHTVRQNSPYRIAVPQWQPLLRRVFCQSLFSTIFVFLSVLRQIYRFPDRIDGISPPMQPGICLSMTRMLFIEEDKQDDARANQRTADQPHEILPYAALHRH